MKSDHRIVRAARSDSETEVRLGPGRRRTRPRRARGAGRAAARSRIFIWQHITKLTLEEVQQVIPLCHPIWARTDPAYIAFTDRHAAQGYFRNRARLTAHTMTALERTGRDHPDQEVLRWAFSRLGS
ncbi:hypothetical protein [Streptomyces sp. NPDC002671]